MMNKCKLIKLTFMISMFFWQRVLCQDVYLLSFNGVRYANNSYFAIAGDSRSSLWLICVTNNDQCCNRNDNPDGVAMGNWYFPDGSLVLSLSQGATTFFRNRDTRAVNLYRRNNAMPPIGVYRCEIPDASGANQTLYVHIGPIRVLSVDLNNNSYSILVEPGIIPSLTCTVSVDPLVDEQNFLITPLSITWSGPVYGTGNFDTEVEKTSNTTYTSTAILNSEGTYYDSGSYRCTVDEVYSDTIIVFFQYPKRPTVQVTSRGQTWTQLNWTQPDSDNTTSFDISYTYVGPCGYTQSRNFILTSDARGYNITDLQNHSKYSFKLSATNRTDTGPPFIGIFTTLSNSAPQVSFATRFSTNITIQLGRINCLERNSEIIGYMIHYYSTNNDLRQTTMVMVNGTDDSERIFTANRLEPLTSYSFQVAGVNSDGERGPFSEIVTFITMESEVITIQLHLHDISNCLEWRERDPYIKIDDVVRSTVAAMNTLCPCCSLIEGDLINPFFMCYHESVHQVTFRAQLKDRSQATAREIVGYIEEWITSSNVVTITVNGVRLQINNTCVVLLLTVNDPECPHLLSNISSFNEVTCIPPTELPTTESTTRKSITTFPPFTTEATTEATTEVITTKETTELITTYTRNKITYTSTIPPSDTDSTSPLTDYNGPPLDDTTSALATLEDETQYKTQQEMTTNMIVPTTGSTQQPESMITLETGAIVGGAVAAVLIIGVVAVTIAVIHRPRHKYRPDHPEARSKPVVVKMSDLQEDKEQDNMYSGGGESSGDIYEEVKSGEIKKTKDKNDKDTGYENVHK